MIKCPSGWLWGQTASPTDIGCLRGCYIYVTICILQFLEECGTIGLRSVHGGKFLEVTTNNRIRATSAHWTPEAHIAVELDPEDPRYVYLKSSHGKYLSASEQGYLKWNLPWKRSWERFFMKRDGEYGSKMALRSVHGLWVSAKGDGTVTADGKNDSSWEHFDIFPNWC